jgi:hypothetical protein
VVKEKVCVLIPVYKKISNTLEIASLKQGLKVFNSFPVIFICPNSFDEAWLDEYRNLHPKITFEKFDDRSFASVDSYSLLLLNQNFYTRFSNYEFMLIYQLDAYVFRDELEYWCDKGFDYIGAPWTKNSNQWFSNLIASDKKLAFYPNAGNGGFSLRNITKISELMGRKIGFFRAIKVRKILRKFRTESNKKSLFAKRIFDIAFFTKFIFGKKSYGEVCHYILQNDIKAAEDIVFAISFPLIFSEFKVAKAEEAIAFAFESEAENLYEINKQNLPFGCHAWYKINPDFWKKFIKF